MAKPNQQLKTGDRKSKWLVPALLAWFSQNARDLPWRRTSDPYAIWVSEIMLQQTQVKTVIPYWERWMRELPTTQAVAKASPDKIHKLWEGLGYYTRVRNLQKAARQIIAQHPVISKSRRRRGDESQTKKKIETPYVVSCKFPDSFADVLALPGVGRYTAGAICSIAFNQPTPILDGNVMRVLTRIFGIAENPRKKKTNAHLWQLAEELVTFAGGARLRRAQIPCAGDPATCKASPGPTESRPTENKHCSSFNQSLMELGALICTPRNPQCQICPAKKLCVAFRQNRVGEFPNLGRRTASTARRFIAFVIERNGKFLVRQRPAGVVNAHLWEFPNVEIGARLSEPQHARWQNKAGTIFATDGMRRCCGSGDPRSGSAAKVAAQVLGFTPMELTPLCTVKHSITRYRITLEAWRAAFGGTSYTSPHLKTAKSGTRGTRPSETGIWKTPAQMQRLAFTAAHKKLASAAINRILFSR